MKKWIAAVMLGVATLAFAQMDRYGNVMDEDGGGYSRLDGSDMAVFFLIWIVAGLLGSYLMSRFTDWSSALIINLCVIGGGLAAVFALQAFV